MIDLICGPLCCGKTTYAQHLAKEKGAVILSVDEIMRLFPDPGEKQYDTVSAGLMSYLLNKAISLSQAGVNVVLDWGFWQAEERSRVRALLTRQQVDACWHYLDVDEATWQERIRKRNAAPESGYQVDEGLLAKFNRKFEKPAPEEMDHWVTVRQA